MIEYIGIHKAFDVPVLCGVDLVVETGETLSIVGPSGTGKSVLLKTTNALLIPDQGDVRVDGESVYYDGDGALQRVRRKVGYVFQYAALFDSMTVCENVCTGLPGGVDVRTPEVLARVAEDVADGGRVVLPEGAEIVGHVIAAQPSGRVKGRARLAVRFQEVRVGGVSYMLEATDLDVTAASGKGKDAKILGGAAGAGAIIGAIAGGGKGALKGAAIGGAAGGAAVLATKGDEVVFKSGESYAVELTRELRVE